jgi:hypothetical protein
MITPVTLSTHMSTTSSKPDELIIPTRKPGKYPSRVINLEAWVKYENGTLRTDVPANVGVGDYIKRVTIRIKLNKKRGVNGFKSYEVIDQDHTEFELET